MLKVLPKDVNLAKAENFRPTKSINLLCTTGHYGNVSILFPRVSSLNGPHAFMRRELNAFVYASFSLRSNRRLKIDNDKSDVLCVDPPSCCFERENSLYLSTDFVRFQKIALPNFCPHVCIAPNGRRRQIQYTRELSIFCIF